ncbi:hypothetical protein HY251_21295, partial [bacterium]|nr:hypothetical protein [bacterium]
MDPRTESAPGALVRSDRFPASPAVRATSYQRLLVPYRPVEVERRLEALLGQPVSLAITANRSSMVRVLPDGERVRLRLHAMFLYAPPPVHEALVRYASRPHDIEANALLDLFIRGETHRIASPGASRAEGERIDLAEILGELNRRFFDPPLEVAIVWSRGSAQRRRRSILFGSFSREPGTRTGVIRIHPALDEDWVPRGFVEFVVHHEMLHALIPTRCEGGRRAFHPREFRQREKGYPGYREWRLWEKENLGRFLGKRR